MDYTWNRVYCLIMQIKKDYLDMFGQFDTYNFETWLVKLNNKQYNEIFECLQINQAGYELLIRYGIAEMQQSMWTDSDSIYRECRSIVIDLYNDAIIIAPFRKFFNLDEVAENKLEIVKKELANAKFVEYTDKKDGSMQSARYYNGEIKLYGSMALRAEGSWRLADGYSKLTDNHKKMIMENSHLTFIFEYISLADAHVVNYTKEQEGLYLIGIRNVYNGKEYSYNKISSFASTYNVPMTDIENISIEQILQDCKKYPSDVKEGWVINIIDYNDNNHRIKIKCDSYVALHRMLDYLSSINVIIQNIANGTYDDLISKVPENYQNRVQNIADQVFNYVHKTNDLIEKFYIQAPKEDKKEFMLWVDKTAPKEIKGYLRQKYLGQKYNVIKTGKGTSASYKKAKEIGIII